MTLRGGAAYPAYVVEFYGLGNDTVKDDDLLDDDYYRFNFNSYQVSTGLVREFWKVSTFGVELNYQYNSETEPVNTSSNILETDDFIGEEQTSLVDAKVALDLDLRDSERLPERGWRLFLSHDNGLITNKDYSNFGKTLGYISWFSTATILIPTTLGLRVGGSHSYGDIPFYRQLSLGEDTYLRGFRKNRFTGDDMFFLNSDLRIKLMGPPYKRWPIDLGLKGFFDFGKIIENEFNFNDLHYGYGFGFYLYVYEDRSTINFTFGFSDEESWKLQFALGAVF